MVVTLARPELLDRRPDWGAGKRSLHLDLPGAPPAGRDGAPAGRPRAGPAAACGAPASWRGPTASRCMRSRPCECCSRRAGSSSMTEPTGRSATWPTSRCPETLTALIAARLDGLDSPDREPRGGCRGPRPELQPGRPCGGLRRDRAALEPRLRTLVRRELFVLDVDPRSPERGQYAFVQALIREVAYNTLSRRDRKVRHLAAARFFETLGTDELAGGLAGHYLAAHGCRDPAEADALAAQARLALRAAAERATALGSHAQALAFLEQALAITTDPADRAELHDGRGRLRTHGPRRSRRAAPRGGCRRSSGVAREIARRSPSQRPTSRGSHRGELSDPARGLCDRGGGMGGVLGPRADAGGRRA